MTDSQTVDVDLGIPLADGDVPIWDAAAGRWKHGQPPAGGSSAVHNSLPTKTHTAFGNDIHVLLICAEITTVLAASYIDVLFTWNGIWNGAAANVFFRVALDDVFVRIGVSPSLEDLELSSGIWRVVLPTTAGLHRVGIEWDTFGAPTFTQSFAIDPAATAVFTQSQQAMLYLREAPST